MIENTKCECGHQNPVGTVLCESCGRPLEDDHSDTPLEMRYDGVARRSQKQNPGIIDRVWRFFSSVRNAIYIIVITLIGASLGTIFPQEDMFVNVDDFAALYKERYGVIGTVYHALGLSHTFSSWWFMLLMFMIAVSLVICSLDRVLPLYKALTRQNVRKHHSFLIRQKVTYSGSVPTGMDDESWTDAMHKALRKRSYRIYRDGSALLAEKYRFSRWGPYVLHIGLILFLIGALLRSVPGWQLDEHVGILEGETKKIENTPYYLKNEKFTVELYDESEMSDSFRAKGQARAKSFETKAVLYTCSANCEGIGQTPQLTEVGKYDIQVNHPLSYKGFQAYQFDFDRTPQLVQVKLNLKLKSSGEIIGSFVLPMKNPAGSYSVGDYTLSLTNYYPDFDLNEQRKPYTKSNEPNTPAFVFVVKGPGLDPNGETYLYFPNEIDKVNFSQDKINGGLGSKIELGVGSMSDVQIANFTTVLNVRVDKAMPIIWAGAVIGMLGLIMGLWQHRRIWLRVDDGQIALGAYTNKNWIGFRKEAASALNTAGITASANELDRGGTEKA